MRDFSKVKTLLDALYAIEKGKTVDEKRTTIVIIENGRKLKSVSPDSAISRTLYSLAEAIVYLAAYDRKVESPMVVKITEDDMEEVYYVTLSGKIPDWCFLSGRFMTERNKDK